MPNEARPHTKRASSDPMVDALLQELMGSGPRTKSSSRSAAQMESVVTSALAEPLMESLARTLAEAAPAERDVLLATLAPVLADALAPAIAQALAPSLAEALTPALITALSELSTTATHKSTGRHSAAGESNGKEERE